MISNIRNRIQPYLDDVYRERPEASDGKPRLKDMLAPGFFDDLPYDVEAAELVSNPTRDPPSVKLLKFNDVTYIVWDKVNLAMFLKVTGRTILNWVSDGAFPTPVLIAGSNYWCGQEVLEWGRSKYADYCVADRAGHPAHYVSEGRALREAEEAQEKE